MYNWQHYKHTKTKTIQKMYKEVLYEVCLDALYYIFKSQSDQEKSKILEPTTLCLRKIAPKNEKNA